MYWIYVYKSIVSQRLVYNFNYKDFTIKKYLLPSIHRIKILFNSSLQPGHNRIF